MTEANVEKTLRGKNSFSWVNEEQRISELESNFPNFRSIPQSTQFIAIMTKIRDKNTIGDEFVFYADRAIRILLEDTLNELPFSPMEVDTPVPGEKYQGVKFSKRICGVSIVRAGESMETALRECARGCRMGKILIQRDEKTALPQAYDFVKLPKDIKDRNVLLLDPMLATGGSAVAATKILLEAGVPEENITGMFLLAAPEGVKNLCGQFTKMRVVAASVDIGLNEKKYIVPGIGDFGDRYFGTE